MIDALECQMAPLDKELRSYARRQPGCNALMAHYGIGELTAVTILAELGDARRFHNSRDAVRYAGLDITVYQSDQHRAPGSSPAKDRRHCAGRSTKPRNKPGIPAAQTTPTTCRPLNDSATTAPASRSPASYSSAATTRCASSATRRSCPHELSRAHQAPNHTDAPRPAPDDCCRHPTRGRPRKIERPQRFPQRDHPIKHHVADPGTNPWSRTEVSPGARAHIPLPQRHCPPNLTATRSDK